MPESSVKAHAPIDGAGVAPLVGASVKFEHGGVAADHEIASRAGAEILKAGGNAVDAAVATSFALSVVRPQSCGIGGGGFMLIHLRDDPRHGTVTTAINYREQCPAAYGPDTYVNDPDPDATTHGGKAVAIPGSVAGLLYALEKYGTMPRERVLAPAIRAAEQGFVVDQHYFDSATEVLEWLDAEPTRKTRMAFVYERMLTRGSVKISDVIRLPEQAAALRLIAERGADAFYRGPIADAVVAAAARDGGKLTKADLASFTVREIEPLKSEFMGRTLYLMPPPSSGGLAIAQVFDILEHRSATLAAMECNSAEYVHLVAEAMKHAFADRSRWLADADAVPVPVKELLSPARIGKYADSFDPSRTLASERYGTAEGRDGEFPADRGTSHFSVVDGKGNAVACTETINLLFGSLVGVPEFGFVLNDEMEDFLTRPGKPNSFGLRESLRNLPAPGKRPLSSMSPMIAVDSQGVVLVAGGSGGPRIIPATLQAALNVLVYDLPAGEALARPRFHHQWVPDRLQLEPGLSSTDVDRTLQRLGHSTESRAIVGVVQLIRRDGSGAGYTAASDPRKGGTPVGY